MFRTLEDYTAETMSAVVKFFALAAAVVAFCYGYPLKGYCQPGEFWNPKLWSCLKCAPGEYMEESNHQNIECLRCTSPSDADVKYDYKELKENCTSTSNTKFQCIDGYYEAIEHTGLECYRCASDDKMWAQKCVRPKSPLTKTPESLHYLETERNSVITASGDHNATAGMTEPTNGNTTEIYMITNSTDGMNAKEDVKPGAIAGIVVGVAAVVIVVAIITLICVCRKLKNKNGKFGCKARYRKTPRDEND